MNLSSSDVEELESKINLIGTKEPNIEFLECVKAITEYVSHFDVATAETRILSKVLPEIQKRLKRIFIDNYSLFETLDDELLGGLIRENLEVVFQLIEVIQELLHYIYQHTPVVLTSIESILKFLPEYVQSFADHWKTSSDSYKNTFIEELSKILQVFKHLYGSFLYLLQFSIEVEEDEKEINLLADALTVLCEMPRTLSDIDPTTVISSWKCFGTVTSKHSSLLEVSLDVRIPVKLLTEDICQVMEILCDHDMMALRRQIKIITFLMKIFFKTIIHTFYQQLNNFATELLIFYVRVSSFSPEYYMSRKFSAEALHVIETDVFKNFDEYLRHLIVEQPVFKDHIGTLSDKLKTLDIYEKNSLGFLNFLNKVLQIIADVDSDSSGLVIKLLEDIFEVLPYCVYEGGIYQQLIVNMSVAILIHDANFRSTEVLLKQIIQDNVFVAVLALEVYTLVVSNIASEECLALLTNLLYGVAELMCGFFTHRPEMVYLKLLLQRLFRLLPDSLKEQVIKLFPTDHFIQIWRCLGFNSLPPHLVQLIMNPVIANTSNCIRSIDQEVSEGIPLNIAEGLDLISTVEDPIITKDPRFSEIVCFVEKFWSLNINSDILNNNIMKYLVFKIAAITASFIQSSSLSPHLVFPKLKDFSRNQAYWIPTFKIITSILNSETPTNVKQDVLGQIADTIPSLMENDILLQELYLEMLKQLNESHTNVLNMLLDSLNANKANQVFQYIESFRKSNEVSINPEYFNNPIPFKHVCLQWNEHIVKDVFTSVKRFKFDQQTETQKQFIPAVTMPTKEKIGPPKTKRKKPLLPKPDADDVDENASSATEVIDRIKGEVKCLIAICKTEKLTPKDVAHLRIVMSQMSSLM